MAASHGLTLPGINFIDMQLPSSLWSGAGAERWPALGRFLPWMLAAALAFILGALAGSSGVQPAANGSDAQVTVHLIDVGQGDALLVETAAARVLIDAGDWWGGGQVVEYLRARDIRRLDAAIVTHPAQDHSGGMEQVLDRLPVAAYYDAGGLGGGSAYRALLDALDRHGVPYRRLRAGDSLELEGGDAALQVLAPFDELQQETLLEEEPDPTLVLRLQVGAVSFLLASRLSERGEARLVRIYGDELDATVLKVAQHGDRRMTGPAFITAVQPELALISAGAYNEFGHPHGPVLQRLADTSTTVLRTDRHGHIRLQTDGRQLIWHSEYAAPDAAGDDQLDEREPGHGEDS